MILRHQIREIGGDRCPRRFVAPSMRSPCKNDAGGGWQYGSQSRMMTTMLVLMRHVKSLESNCERQQYK